MIPLGVARRRSLFVELHPLLERELTRLSESSAELQDEARSWFSQWVAGPLEELAVPFEGLDGFVAQLAHAVPWYRLWHERGVDGRQAGLMDLYQLGIKAARGQVDRGSEAATDTYLDVRERLETSVDRARRGRSVPDFRRPGPDARLNVHRYHRLQLNLRLEGKWSPRRDHDPLDGELMASDTWARGFEQADARCQAIVLHFAALWFHQDVREKRTRQGVLKDRGWWWQMLQHGLGVVQLGDLGGDRNDPVEAMLRIQLRASVARGAVRWLRLRTRNRPYWQQVDLGLPDPTHGQAGPELQRLLDELRPTLEVALANSDASPDELKALRGALLRGQNLRTSLKRFEGQDRRERMMDLGERAGREVAARLLDAGEGSGGPGGGGASGGAGGPGGGAGGSGGDGLNCPDQTRPLMRSLAAGQPPQPHMLRSLQSHLSTCTDCQAYFASLAEEPTWLPEAAAFTPEPTPTRSRVPLFGLALGAAALAALLVVVVPGPKDPDGGGPTLRGIEAKPRVLLDLSVQVQGADQPARFREGQTYHIGDRVYFHLSTDQGTSPAALWVEGPEGKVQIGKVEATVAPSLFDEGRTFYTPDRAGTYTFLATPAEDGSCPEDRCTWRAVRVEAR